MAEHKKTPEKRNEILRHFCAVVESEGFENASIQKIAAHANMNSSLIIFYFKNKEELVLHMVDFLLKQYENAFFEDINQTSEPKKRFQKAIEILFGERWVEVGNPVVFYACYYLSTRNEQVRGRFEEMYQKFRAILTQEAEIWVKNGLVQLQNPAEIAEYLIMLNEGLSFYQRIYRREDYSQRALSVKKLALLTLGQAQGKQ